MVKARKYVAVNRFDGIPEREDFKIVEHDLPPIKNGEILVKAEWISVDPNQQVYKDTLLTPHDQFSYQVGLVVDSKDPRYPVETRIVSHKGWCDYSILNANDISSSPLESIYKLPDLKGLSNSLAVGAVGIAGATAYFGLLEICKPKHGETVVVTDAAGAVGSIVGQIARSKGCRVIGFTNTDEKVKWLEQELGFDKAFNDKTADVHQVLKKAAPDGVDCYFDNVGGEISSIIINQMNVYGRVAVNGIISSYSADFNKRTKAAILQIAIVTNELKVEGFSALRWKERWPVAFADLTKRIKSRQLDVREHVTEGFENIYDAFVGMLKGDQIGNAVVKI